MTNYSLSAEDLDALIADHEALVQAVRAEIQPAILAAGQVLVQALGEGATVFACGNGGSAADAQHLCAELIGRFAAKNRRPLPAVALTVDASAMTSISNDFGYQHIFSRQIEGLGRAGDVLVGISTSGRSGNVLAALERAHALGMRCVGLAGADGSAMAPYCEAVVTIPHPQTARVQEMHLLVYHAWCAMVDAVFAGKG